jgi:hypothetical protein
MHPDPPQIAEIKTALSTVSKTPFWEKTFEDYDQAAYMVAGWDCTAADIKDFAKWWKAPGNGHYQGKPALKSLLQEFPNFIQARHQQNGATANGEHREPDIELEKLMQQMEVKK